MAGLKGLPPAVGSLGAPVRALPKVADRFYLSVDWKRLRKAKAAQGAAFCCVCGIGGPGVRLILDHRNERRDGGADMPSLDELDWYCTGHHNRKTAEARARRAGRSG